MKEDIYNIGLFVEISPKAFIYFTYPAMRSQEKYTCKRSFKVKPIMFYPLKETFVFFYSIKCYLRLNFHVIK